MLTKEQIWEGDSFVKITEIKTISQILTFDQMNFLNMLWIGRIIIFIPYTEAQKTGFQFLIKFTNQLIQENLLSAL